jgi:GH15 family glucan-1,4-alpha-glucosidase
MSASRRSDGYVEIADYAVIGDGRTAALVARDGRIDWWPFPTLDAPPVCAAILDTDRGGWITMEPEGEFGVTREYVPGTNVLQNTYVTATGTARVTVALNTGSAGRLPWTELVHRVEGLRGSMPMRFRFEPGSRFGRANPWVEQRQQTPVVTVEDQTLAVIASDAVRLGVCDGAVEGRFTTAAGDRNLVAIVGSDREPTPIPVVATVDERLDRTMAGWQRWTALLDTDGEWAEPMERSALALKTLIAEDTGAIAAAATTSLPEAIGGTKNWDYRYAWVRDSSFTLDALINLGASEEVHGAVSWLLGALRRNGPALRVFYALNGDLPGDGRPLDAPGYRHSRPVRDGNSAHGQTQLGTYGDLFDTIGRYCDEGHLIDDGTGRQLADLADRCCDDWQQRDSGIWELDDLQHYTISKIGCWVALDRAVRLARQHQIPDDHADRWEQAAGWIREWVETRCWSTTKQSYTLCADSDALDAAVLLAARTGFDRGWRMTATIDALDAELGRGPTMYRYSGMEREEGAFVACSFWMVEALVHTGQLDRANQLMGAAVALANDVGLFAEQIDPDTGQFLGNVPQGLSHLALINAAAALRRVEQASS